MSKKAVPQQSRPDFSLLTELKKFGYRKIVGADEVGRGAIAGPIVVAVVEISDYFSGVTDSKLISKRERTRLAELLYPAVTVSIGSSSNVEIDELGLGAAQRLAYSRALKGIEFDLILADHYNPPTSIAFIRATKGEKLFYPVAAASIIAKVYRDQLMSVYARFFPEFGWETNAGYATKYHLEQIRKIGKTILHRYSFIN